MSARYHEKAAMESCKRANMTNAALVIESLMQQRAELLEALKLLIEDADSTCETYDIAKSAITRAEAEE